MNLSYTFNSGKNPKWIYYVKGISRLMVPRVFYRLRRDSLLKHVSERADYDYIMDRVNYYNRLEGVTLLPENAKTVAEHTYRKRKGQKAYFFDTYEYIRWFPLCLRWLYISGDVFWIPDYPSIVKSRPIAGENENSVLLKLNKVRHFIFLQDRIPFCAKKDMTIFRGKVGKKFGRKKLMEMYIDHPMCDLGDTSKTTSHPVSWLKSPKTLYAHLEYKFILALEGNDVASNLKWVMSSNSVAVMPKPTCETWFMEGRLIANYHYIEIKSDYSDLEERLRYYIEHPDAAQEIVNHANEYVEQFKNKRQEKLISLLVLKKYFEHVK